MEPWNPQMRTTTERRRCKALVQAHRLLARIVVEIRSADLAVETVVYRDVFYADNADEFPCCTRVLVFLVVFEILLFARVPHGTTMARVLPTIVTNGTNGNNGITQS